MQCLIDTRESFLEDSAMRRVLLIALGLISFSYLAHAQAKKSSLYFDCTCDDAVGRLYATAFRDLLASSPRYQSASVAEVDDEKGNVVRRNWNVKVVSLDPARDAEGQRTVLSVVLIWGDLLYVDSLVQTCNKNNVASCVSDTLADLDNDIQKVNAAVEKRSSSE